MPPTDEATIVDAGRRKRVARVLKALRAIDWERRPVRTISEYGIRRTVDADVCRGLAVHRDPNYDAATGAYDTWTVTHVRSGRAVVRCLPKERHARLLAVRLLALDADWTLDQEALRAAVTTELRNALCRWGDDVYAPGPDDPAEG